MLRIKVSKLQQSEIVNIGKILYTIELDEDSMWAFKKADTKIVIDRHKDKQTLKQFASSYCNTHNAQLYIKDNFGNLEEIVQF